MVAERRAPCAHVPSEVLQSGGEPTNAKVPTARRQVTKKKAECFAAAYINSEQAAGRSPTLRGFEVAAKNAGMRGGREYLRAAFRGSCRVESAAKRSAIFLVTDRRARLRPALASGRRVPIGSRPRVLIWEKK